jgi:hypothetical protein
MGCRNSVCFWILVAPLGCPRAGVSATAIYTLTRSDAPYRSIDSAKLAAARTARRIAREQPGKSVDIMLTAPDQRADKVNVTVQ